MSKDYLYQLGQRVIKDNLDLTITKRFRKSDPSKTKTYFIKCNKCGFDSEKETYKNGERFEYSIEEYNLKNQQYCPCCSFKLVQVGINDIPTTAPWMVPYFQGGYDEAKKYSQSSTKKLLFKCPDCGELKHNKTSIQQLYKLGKISCVCQDGMSLPERIMYYILLETKIDFEYQYSPEWCKYFVQGEEKSGIYDFYFCLNENKYIVEMDGAFHFSKHFKGKSVKEQQIIDNLKDSVAIENGVNVIRVDCRNSKFEYIKESIISSELSKILQLDNLRWEYIQDNTQKNICKIVCNDYSLKNQDTILLSEKYHLSRTTIINYLNIGNKNKWCSYKGNKRTVYQYDLNGNLIRKWESGNEAIRQTGISSINYCLRKKTSQAGGYYWTYEKE